VYIVREYKIRNEFVIGGVYKTGSGATDKNGNESKASDSRYGNADKSSQRERKTR